MTTGTRKTGEICWTNMLTPKPDQARTFFGKLLGWTYVELPGMGHIVRVGGRDIGGLFDVVSPQTPKGTPPVIGVMVKVDSADAAAAKVRKLGGQAKPAFDIADSGRMAVCFDPNGAEFDVWQPKKMRGFDVDSLAPGAPTWFETLTTDAARAVKFYSDLFGWTPQPKPMPGFDYTVFSLGDTQVAGAMPMLPHMAGTPPHWATYFTVRDCDAAARQTTELGGKVCVPPQDIPDIGRFCGITSPQGVTFYVIQYGR
jgi:predicted enzyme related to lactoylglutathione lyase